MGIRLPRRRDTDRRASPLGDYAWYAANSAGKYQKVGTKKPNAWGLYDMLGNVMEWTLDQYAPYPAGAQVNPWVKATQPYPHAVRGGSWNDPPEMLRCTARVASDASWKQQDPQLPKSIWYLTDAQWLGFRLVRPAKASHRRKRCTATGTAAWSMTNSSAAAASVRRVVPALGGRSPRRGPPVVRGRRAAHGNAGPHPTVCGGRRPGECRHSAPPSTASPNWTPRFRTTARIAKSTASAASAVGKPVKVSADLFRVLAAARQLAEETDGAFDVTLGPVTVLWRQARREHRLPAPDALREALQRSGYRKLHLDAAARTVTLDQAGMRLDLGGIGKGYAADAALAALAELGIRRALVAASGDLAIGDPPPGRKGWSVGIDSPDRARGGFARVLDLCNAAVSTSGDRRAKPGDRRREVLAHRRSGHRDGPHPADRGHRGGAPWNRCRFLVHRPERARPGTRHCPDRKTPGPGRAASPSAGRRRWSRIGWQSLGWPGQTCEIAQRR